MKQKYKGKWDLEPQKSSAAQYLTYIASYGISDEKFEIRYEDENIWMSQKMLAAVYGVDLRTVSYHITKIFKDAELDENSVIQKIWITAADGKKCLVNHYSLKVIIALGFKIDNERAVAFRKWANEIVGKYTIQGLRFGTARSLSNRSKMLRRPLRRIMPNPSSRSTVPCRTSFSSATTTATSLRWRKR